MSGLISAEELQSAVNSLKKDLAPGIDDVTNKILQHLDVKSLALLLENYNSIIMSYPLEGGYCGSLIEKNTSYSFGKL